MYSTQFLDLDRNYHPQERLNFRTTIIFNYPYRWMFSFVLTPMKLTCDI